MTNTHEPFEIDFLNPELQYRRKHATLKNEWVARAMGLRKNDHSKIIIDATAGLGRDSFILASLGFNVTMLERSPIIYEALIKAFKNAQADSETQLILSRITLIQTDAIHYLKAHFAHIVYLDPMFPLRKKSALSKKNIRQFHEWVGDDKDADQLLASALTCATERVVVKRPRLAEAISGPKPSYNLIGSSNRFDVYLINKGR